jgi:hypothetical protein
VVPSVGVSFLSRGRKARARLDYTYRWLPGYGGFSAVGLGMAVHLR